MPELPEVEAARRLLETHCRGQKLTGCSPVDPFDSIVFSDAEACAASVSAALLGKSIVAVHRKGKQLWLELSSPPHLLAHFGMTGAFVVEGVKPLMYKEFKVHDEEWPPRFTKLELTFSSGTRLAFCDPRRLGRLRLRSAPESQEPISALAPDPLLSPITAGTAKAALKRTGKTIKALLLDQSALVSGVGNWVADEILFQSGIHPEAPCNTLSDRQAECMHKSLLHIVTSAVAANAESSSFPDDWLFHYRWGKGSKGGGGPVPGPKGGAISFITVGGRTSAVVLSQQKKGELKGGATKAAEGGATEAKKAAKLSAAAGTSASSSASSGAGEAPSASASTSTAASTSSKSKRKAKDEVGGGIAKTRSRRA